MIEFFQYSFMIRALIAGLLAAVTLPLLGGFLVARRYALIADSLSHVALAGIGAGILLGSQPILTAVPVAVSGALLLEYLRQKKRISGDTSLAILMSGGLAFAVVLANLAQNARTDFSSFLFGSVTTTTRLDIVLLAAASSVTLAVLLRYYRSFLHIAFDEDSARIAGHKVGLLNYVLVALTAVMVVLSMRIVGGLLISALLVIPIVAAGRFSSSFKQTVILGTIFSILAVVCGLIAAFYMGVAAGGAIVLAVLLIFVFSLLLSET